MECSGPKRIHLDGVIYIASLVDSAARLNLRQPAWDE